MKRIFAILIIASSLCSLEASGQLTVGEFLLSAINDPEVQTFTQQISYLDTKPYRLAPLQKLEVRVQNRELIYDQQQYALRLSPANPWEVRNNNRYFQNFTKSLSSEREIVLKQALTDRYYNVIELVYLTAIESYSDSMQFYLDQQLAILERQYASSYFDADEYVKLKVEQLDNMVSVEEINYDLAGQRHRISRLYPAAHKSTLAWALDDLISVDRIEFVVDSLSKAAIVSTLVAHQQQKIELAQSEYKLERSNVSIGYFQTQFDQRRVEQDRTPINLGFGFTIPLFNPNKGDMAKKKLDVIEAQYDLEEATQEGETDKLILEDRLAGLILRFRNLETRIRELRTNNFAQTLSTIKGGDPLIVAQFNQRVGKMNDLLIKIKRDVLITYVDYLAFTDNLQQQPLINFLSARLEQIPK